VKRIPSWALASSAAAPVVLATGLISAESRQPAGYNPIRDTISSLAAQGATDRWVMTSALAGLGVCHVITAVGLRPARSAGRALLAGGGVATLMVAAFPQPERGNSVAHTIAAALAFTGLALWPIFAAESHSDSPVLTYPICIAASVLLSGLVLWFVAEVHGGHRGLAERAAAGSQAVWPLVVVIATRRVQGRSRESSSTAWDNAT
jgi:hypothetical membrane protein